MAAVGETYSEKAKRKFKENPFVPLGCLLTVGALTVASRRMVQGDSTKLNYWLRMRVIMQGLTIVGVLGGSYYFSENGPSNTTNRDEDARKLILERERAEFQQRLALAEQRYYQEVATAQREGKPLPSTKLDLEEPRPSMWDWLMGRPHKYVVESLEKQRQVLEEQQRQQQPHTTRAANSPSRAFEQPNDPKAMPTVTRGQEAPVAQSTKPSIFERLGLSGRRASEKAHERAADTAAQRDEKR